MMKENPPRRLLLFAVALVTCSPALPALLQEDEVDECANASFVLIQSTRHIYRTEQTAQSQQTEQDARLRSFRDMMHEEAEPLRWRKLRSFPSMKLEAHPECSNIGRRFPPMASRSPSLLSSYAEYTCKTHANYFATDPAVGVDAEVAELDGGCVNLHAFPSVTYSSNSSHGQYLYRQCPEGCLQDQVWRHLPTEVIDEDLLVLPSSRVPPGMAYQHSLMDFLPQAWTVLPLMSGSSMKIVSNHAIQSRMLEILGVPAERIHEVFLTAGRPDALLCVKSGRALRLWRTGSGLAAETLPTWDYGDSRIDGDLWHRLINFQVGPEVSDAIAHRNGFKEEPFAPALVVFLQRCTSRRHLENEQAALATVSQALVDFGRSEELLSVCAGREELLEQAEKVRQARLIIAAHGGALANMVFARRGTGIIELVGDAKANEHLQGAWPPYKSLWYGGSGAAFPFYRVVLYEANASGKLWIRLADLQDAVSQWMAHPSGASST